ncbi:uncharacterized protein LOC111003173 [Pieris rapae]|uniref:uncharacterized protein LOC111003173 n=1 Tax=Pieris rapae TaxID=64459 RepID=UPI001E28102C|nr:uncharacterized protein LOC111003173 [Pieris rapae]XP_022129250.2 uncharacterized protein LOC111003173 [Pieris rapae]
MSDVKQVKVDNWGIYFLQRLKHFFNRTDYCDLTLQFQDNAQLKVHRLVLNSCTEYFEILERTCEMYSDCLVMPDDLQADVVVPIVNFMYTGQLEFKMDLLEKLYQTSLIMNMPVLTKLLNAHRVKPNLYGKRYSRNIEPRVSTPTATPTAQIKKRSFNKAFPNDQQVTAKKKFGTSESLLSSSNGAYGLETSLKPVESSQKKNINKDPKPTRYELPAELDDDNIFDNSFTSLSYESKPLMVHPETTKYYTPKKARIFDEPSNSKKFLSGTTTMDIVECRKITPNDFFEDVADTSPDDSELFLQQNVQEKKDSSQLFDQILIKDSKISIEKKDKKEKSHLDHAKIISEVLKKYPHLVKSNKNIKLKILNNPNSQKKQEPKLLKPKTEVPDFTYETDVVDSQEAARLIAMGADNVKGPWICLICGTPGRALHFTSYYNYRRHLVEVHNEKPVSNMCEYCGLKSPKRNYLVHHLYTKHGVEPPRAFHFPKCNICSYVALTEAFLVKHKMSHSDNHKFRCAICASSFHNSNLLLKHIQKTGHKFSAEKKPSPQCIYCYKMFTRDSNLYAHLKSNHYESAKNDGIIEDSDDEKESKIHVDTNRDGTPTKYIEVNVPGSFDNQYDETSYNVQQRSDGNIEIVTKKPPLNLTPISKKKILNAGLSKTSSSGTPQKVKIIQEVISKSDFIDSPESVKKEDGIVVLDNNEFFFTENYQTDTEEIITSETSQSEYSTTPHNSTETSKLTLSKSNPTMNQPIQIVVSNEEEYKALLSSNHSIIFDERVSDKPLTVLATSSSGVGDTINLSNPQSNEMMIVPETFPINISASNTTDNSNIVVVYSHPVSEQNKHFQLITSSQGLNNQFIQSSAIFTQNFETVTTTAPVMAGQIVVNNTTVGNSWQNNLPIATSEMQIITSEVHVGDPVNNIPQVEIMQPGLEVPLPQSLPNLDETDISVNSNFLNANTTTKSTNADKSVFQNTTLIPISKLPSLSSLSQSMVINSPQVGMNIIQSEKSLETKEPHAIMEIPITEQSNIVDMPSNIDEELKTEPIFDEPASIVDQPDSIMDQTESIEPKEEQSDCVTEPNALVCPHQDVESNIIVDSGEKALSIELPQDPTNIREQETVTMSAKEETTGDNAKLDISVTCEHIQDTTETRECSNDIADCIPESNNANSHIDEQPLITSDLQQNHNIIMEQDDKFDHKATIAIPQMVTVEPKTLLHHTSTSVTKDIQISEIENTLSEHTLTQKADFVIDTEEQKQNQPVLISEEDECIKTEDEETIENIARDIEAVPKMMAVEIMEEKPYENTNKPLIKDIDNLTSEWSDGDGEEGTDPSIKLTQAEVAEDKPECMLQSNELEPDKNIDSVPQEKISSLLNDWEENSQEETISDSVSAIPTEVIKNTTNIISDKLTMEKVEPQEGKKHNDIRKLVSDWDDDVEEDHN